MILRTTVRFYISCENGAAHISGLVIPFVARAQSLYALQAIKIDSVPPDVAKVKVSDSAQI